MNREICLEDGGSMLIQNVEIGGLLNCAFQHPNLGAHRRECGISHKDFTNSCRARRCINLFTKATKHVLLYVYYLLNISICKPLNM